MEDRVHVSDLRGWLGGLRALLFDIDGVLHRGGALLPGAAQMPQRLERLGIRWMCVTNNASKTPAQVAEELRAFGVAAQPEQVITSAVATAAELRRRAPAGTPVYAIGMRGLQEPLFDDGYFVFQARKPEYVVVGVDFEVTYEKLRLACLAIRDGAHFIGTNPDLTFPTQEGLIPGCGALLAALVAAGGVQPEIIGKPQPGIFHAALQLLGVEAGAAAMVGDRLDTDIDGAHAAGLTSIMVETGVDSREAAQTWPNSPELIVRDLAALLDLLEEVRR